MLIYNWFVPDTELFMSYYALRFDNQNWSLKIILVINHLEVRHWSLERRHRFLADFVNVLHNMLQVALWDWLNIMVPDQFVFCFIQCLYCFVYVNFNLHFAFVWSCFAAAPRYLFYFKLVMNSWFLGRFMMIPRRIRSLWLS